MVRGGRAEAPALPRSDVSFRLDQKTGNFKVATASREKQWNALTEQKQKNKLAKKVQFRFTQTVTIIRWKGGTITCCSSPLYQRCTAAKDGKLQGGLVKQTNAVECFD